MNKRELIKQMKKRGWRFFLTKSAHLGFIHAETGQKLHTASTPSDHRSWKNFLARAKRLEKDYTDATTT